jgi:hypothetical protein
MFLFIAYNLLFELFMPDATHYFVMTAKKESLLRYSSLQSNPNQIKTKWPFIFLQRTFTTKEPDKKKSIELSRV